jgi:hypothetical protein
MKLPDGLNPVARAYAARLLDDLPELASGFEALEGGNFEVSLPAPAGSRAGALVCRSFADGHVWVRFAPPDACYPVESAEELVAIVKALLDETAVFAVIREGERWAGSTLIAPGAPPPLAPGQRADVFSWSGTQDEQVSAARARKGKARPRTTRR